MPASRGDVRALHIHEILSAVFQELDKASLASCARVCHDWEPLASRTLWRDLSDDKEGLSALVNLLGDVNQDLHELTFRDGGFSPQNWARYAYYSSFVRFMTLHVGDGHSCSVDLETPLIHPNTLVQLHTVAIANRSSILPQVKILHITPWGSTACERVLLLVSDHIKTFYADWMDEDERTLIPVLQRLSHCPNLTTLSIRANDTLGESSLVSDATARALGSLTQLQELGLATNLILQPQVWQVLQNLPALKSLEQTQSPSNARADIQSSAHLHLSQGFASLYCINFRMSHRELGDLLQQTATAPIRQATLRVFDAGSTADFRDVTTSLGGALPNLEYLCIDLDHSLVRVKLAMLSPLFQLKHLTHIYIGSDAAADLSDEDFKYLSEQVPQLKELELCPDPLNETPASATLLALVHIAKNCRSVQYVCLYIDTTTLNLPSFSTVIAPFSNRLREISFGLSPVSDPNDIARHLFPLLATSNPILTECRSGLTRSGRDDDDDDLRRRYDEAKADWDKVMAEISSWRPVFQAVQGAAGTLMQ